MSGHELFAWQEREPSGAWGVIAIASSDGNETMFIPLLTRSREKADEMRQIAMWHRATTGHTIRLARFIEAEVIEVVGS